MKDYDPSQDKMLKQLKISLQDRQETIRCLDAEILDDLEDEKEIEEAGVFSEKILEIVVEIDSVPRRQTWKWFSVVEPNNSKIRQQKQVRKIISTHFEEFLRRSKPVVNILG